LAETTAGPATSGTVFGSDVFFLGAAAVFFTGAFFRLEVDFFGAVVVGVGAGVGASTAGIVGMDGIVDVVAGGGSGGGACMTAAELVASCAKTLVESAAAKIIQSFFFINLPK
jgi:hypothetical protein